MTINGKTYRLWGQFVRTKENWIGGILHETSDGLPPGMVEKAPATEIVDIKLEPNGKDSAMFSIVGKDYTCSCDVQYLGLGPRRDGKRGFRLHGYGGHTFTIEPAPGKEIEVTE